MINKKVVLPEKLTAENGAKYLLLGKFSETVELTCSECYIDNDDDCDVCGGAGYYEQKVIVSWGTIKDIYDAIVDGLGEVVKDEANN